MSDESVLKVLEEIRDLQRRHAENYEVALRNQQESIRLQYAGLKRARLALTLAGVVLLLAVAMLVMLLLKVAERLG